MLDPKECLLAERWINGAVAAGYLAAFLVAATAGGSTVAASLVRAPSGPGLVAGPSLPQEGFLRTRLVASAPKRG